jgi:sulfocyanin SoxE-like protein
VVAALLAAGAVSPARFLSVDARRHRVTLRLVAAYDGANNGFNFDGYGRGELLVSVPLGWRVSIDCSNRGPLRHSCAVVAGARTTTPAFPHAATPELAVGKRASFSFVASRRGTYRLACLVPGHEEARMWDVLDVGKTRRVEISARPGP